MVIPEFSFELLYRQLGFDSPLPTSCRSLIKFALANDNAQQRARTSKFYLNQRNGINRLAFRRPTILLIGQSISFLLFIFARWFIQRIKL